MKYRKCDRTNTKIYSLIKYLKIFKSQSYGAQREIELFHNKEDLILKQTTNLPSKAPQKDKKKSIDR